MSIRKDLLLEQGATFQKTIDAKYANGEYIDLSDFSARAKMKRHYTSSNSISIGTDVGDNSIILDLPAGETASISPGRYVYDLEIYNDDGYVIRVVEGIITVTPEVSD